MGDKVGLLNQLVARSVLGLPVRRSAAVVPHSSGGLEGVTWQDLENDGLACIGQPGAICLLLVKPDGNADDCSLHTVSVCKTAICAGCTFRRSCLQHQARVQTIPFNKVTAPCAFAWTGSLILLQTDSCIGRMVCTHYCGHACWL